MSDDQTATPQPAADTFSSGDEGIRQAGAELASRRDEQEAAAPAAPQIDHDEIKTEQRRREAGRAGGVPDFEDGIDKIMVLDGSEEVKPRNMAKELADLRAARAVEEAEIRGERDEAAKFEGEYAAVTQGQEAPAETAPETEQYDPETWQRQQEAAAAQRAERDQAAQNEINRAIELNERALAISNRQLESFAASEMPELVEIARLANTSPLLAERALAEFAQRDPQKFARFQQLDAAWRNSAQQAQRIAEHRQHEHRIAFRDYAKAEDDRFTAMHPEMNDPVKAASIQAEAIEVLQELGLGREQIKHLYENSSEFRSAAAQSLLYRAVQQRRVERSMRDIRRKPVPPVQRPGVARSRGEADEHHIQTLNSRLNGGGQRAQLQAAADLLVARRAAAARRS